MSLDAKGLEAAAKALEKSSGDSEECCPEIGGCGGTHTDCWYRSRAADTIRAYSAAVLPPDESEAAKAVAAGRAAASSDPPTSWECCGHTFTGTADFISGARSAHVCDIAPEDVPDAETAYAMGKAAATPPAEGSVSYRVRDRDSDYKAMCHENREHAELLLQAWLADGRDAVIESRIVYDDGWRPDAECRAPHCWSEYGTPCATCPKEKR